MKKLRQHGNLNSLAVLRKRIGLNQEQLAELLQVHRSTIKLAEQGKRTLPMPSLLIMANLEIMLASGLPANNQAPIHPCEQEHIKTFNRHHDQLFKRELICRMEQDKLKKKLAVKVSLYKKTRQRLHIIDTAIQLHSNDLQTVQFWKDLQQTDIHTLQTCGLVLQVLLRCRIAILDAEAELYMRLKLEQKNNLPDFFFEDQRPGC